MTNTTTTTTEDGTTTVTTITTQDSVTIAIDVVRALAGVDLSSDAAVAAKQRDALNAAYERLIDALT